MKGGIRIAYLGFLLPLLLLSNCKTATYIQLEVLVVPDSVIPIKEKDILLTNRSLMIEPEKLKGKDSIVLHNGISRRAVLGLTEKLFQSEVVDTQTLSRIEVFDFDTIHRDVAMNPKSVLQVIDSRKIDLVISLEHIDIDFFRSYDLRTGVNQGGTFEEYFVSIITAIAECYWRTYEGSSGVVIDEKVYRDTLVWEEYGGSYSEATERLGDPLDIVWESAYWTGYHSAEKMVPYWTEVDRFYYINGSKGLREGAKNAGIGEWDRAIEFWIEETRSGNPVVAARAAHNMAFVSEMNDLLDLAVEWAQKSINYKSTLATESYLEVLKERLSIKQSLINK